MINVRQVANVEVEGQEFTLVNVIVKTADNSSGVYTAEQRNVNQVFTNISDLYVAIRTNVNQALSNL